MNDDSAKRTRRLKLSLILVSFLCSLLMGCGSSKAATPQLPKPRHVLSQSCPSTFPVGQPVGYWPLNTNPFQGIFQFTGQANTKNAGNPAISGADLQWSWAQIEPVEGQYDWTKVDRDIRAWISNGKSVILRFSAAGNKNWSGTVNGSYTPGWLFDRYGVPRVTEIDGTIFPLYWNPTYLQKLADFVHTAAARYDTNPYVAAVEIGVGQGGETEPDGTASHNTHQLQLWQSYGYTNALWWQTIQKIVRIYEAAWTHTPLALMVTSTFLQYQDKRYNRALVEKYAVSQGLWLQINSLNDSMSSGIFQGGENQLTTTLEEQKQSAQDSGYAALHDIKHGIALGARYILVFAVDLSNPGNADALRYAAQNVQVPLLTDCSASSLTLSTTGRVTPVPGVSGLANDYAQFFDGSTGSAQGAHAPVSSSSIWSLDGWMYPTVLPQTEAVVVMNGADGNGGGGFGFGIAAGSEGGTGSQLVAYFPGVGWIDSGYTIPATRQWYHIIVTCDGNTVRFYVNGAQTSGTGAHLPHAAPTHFSIGSGYDLSTGTANHFFAGAVEDVATYANALSASQVKSYHRP